MIWKPGDKLIYVRKNPDLHTLGDSFLNIGQIYTFDRYFSRDTWCIVIESDYGYDINDFINIKDMTPRMLKYIEVVFDL